MTTEHEEWAQLNYVLTLAIGELESVGVPIRIRSVYSEKISYLKSTLASKDIKAVSKIVIRMADPYIIKQLKMLAIAILNKTSNERTAWRLDYAEFFERYVQFIFRDVAKKKVPRHFKIRTLEYLMARSLRGVSAIWSRT